MKYRRDIDGLRAVAVIPVILFHAGFSVFRGGYVGVDVFFVISGFLITSILISDLEKDRFSIAGFYERRARRILPALFFVMFACIPFAYMWMLPHQLRDFELSLVSVVLFTSNFLFWRESGYFAPNAELMPLLHTWSLAVEEQYYLLFPIFLLLAWRFGRNTVFWSIATIAVLSLLLAEWGWRNAPSANFYLAPTRAWELLAGSLCAFLTVGRSIKQSNLLSAIGLAAIVFAILYFDNQTPFPSVYTLVPVLGTVLIILFGGQGTFATSFLSTRVFVGVGLISYSAYLWHQPLFAFARLRSLTEPSSQLMAALAAAALLLAWGTWHWIEKPFRNRSNRIVKTRSGVFYTSGVLGVLFFAFGSAGYLGKGFELSNRDSVTFSKLEDRMVINWGLSTDCKTVVDDSRSCRTSDAPRVLLWGDSFAMHLAQGIVASDPNVALQQHTITSCAPILGVTFMRVGRSEERANRCIEFNNEVFDWLSAQDHVELVVISSMFQILENDQLLLEDGSTSREGNVKRLASYLLETVEKIREKGARVVIVSPTPDSGWDVGHCLLRSVFFELNENSCDFLFETETVTQNFLRDINETVPVYWLHDDICLEGVCDAMREGHFVFRDRRHLSVEGSKHLGASNSWMSEFSSLAY